MYSLFILNFDQWVMMTHSEQNQFVQIPIAHISTLKKLFFIIYVIL